VYVLFVEDGVNHAKTRRTGKENGRKEGKVNNR
jgi:hypothetical protein